VSTSDVVQACFKLLTVVLREHKWVLMKEAQVRVLIKFVGADLTDSKHQHTTFALLKVLCATAATVRSSADWCHQTIYGRRVAIPELYDIAARLGEIVVRSEDATLREQSRRVLLEFLLHYPLADKRRNQARIVCVLGCACAHRIRPASNSSFWSETWTMRTRADANRCWR
jgi:U3 small nucleolar RNA-associated protein 20